MQVNNPTGSGGSGTVTTDGVTIQGDGSGGNPIAIKNAETDGVTMQGAGTVASKIAIKAVTLSARLTGTGAVGSGLDIAGWPIAAFAISPISGAGTVQTANKLQISGFVLPHAVTFSKIAIYINTADAVNNSDFGIYSIAGTLLANIGAQTIAGTAGHTFNTVQGSQTIAPGLYIAAATSNASTLAINTAGAGYSFMYATGFGSSAGGALPNSITPPAFAFAISQLAFLLF